MNKICTKLVLMRQNTKIISKVAKRKAFDKKKARLVPKVGRRIRTLPSHLFPLLGDQPFENNIGKRSEPQCSQGFLKVYQGTV